MNRLSARFSSMRFGSRRKKDEKNPFTMYSSENDLAEIVIGSTDGVSNIISKLTKEKRCDPSYFVQIQENADLLSLLSSLRNAAENFWKSCDTTKSEDFKSIIYSFEGNFEIFFFEYKQTGMSCFEKLCSTPSMDKCIEIFLEHSKNTVDKSSIEKKYLNKESINEKGPLDYAILAGNMDSVCHITSVYETSVKTTIKAIGLIDGMLRENANSGLDKFKNGIRCLLKYETKFADEDWDKLFEIAANMYGETTREVLIGFFPDIKLSPSIQQVFLNKVPEESRLIIKLFNHIQNRDEESFLSDLEVVLYSRKDVLSDFFCVKKKYYTLFQLACEKGLIKIVEILLEKPIDINFGLYEKVQPIFLAFVNGHREVLSLLFKNKEIILYDQKMLNDMMTELIFKNKLNDENNKDFMDCLAILKKDDRASVMNVCSVFLIKTIDSSNESTVMFLLRNGASLNFTYEPFLGTFHNEFVLENLSTKTLSNYLDECLDSHREKNVLLDEVLIDINYSFIKPIILNRRNDSEKEEILPEMEILMTMSKIPQLKPLIKHPVIQSFLYLKWQKLKYMFYINFVYFLCFWLFLTIHIYLDDEINNICDKITMNLILCMLVILIVKNVVQFCMFPLYFIKRIENWLEMLVIVFSSFLVFYENSTSYSTRVDFGVIAVFILSSLLILLMAKFPLFAVHFAMLKKVTWNFSRFMVSFSIFFICFSLILYKVFRKNPEESTPDYIYYNVTNVNMTIKVPKFDYFLTYERSLFKTLIMFTGELDAGNLEYGSSHMTYGTLVVFIFVVTFVLYNFLNGLAISDIQHIKKDAELVSLVNRIQVMSYIECLVFGTQMKKDSSKDKSFARKVFRSIFSRKDFHHAKIKQPFIKFFAEKICLFPDISKRNKITVSLSKPLKGKRFLSLVRQKNDLFDKDPMKIYIMDKKIVNLAHLKIKEKFEEEKRSELRKKTAAKIQTLGENQLKHDAILTQILEILRKE